MIGIQNNLILWISFNDEDKTFLQDNLAIKVFFSFIKFMKDFLKFPIVSVNF